MLGDIGKWLAKVGVMATDECGVTTCSAARKRNEAWYVLRVIGLRSQVQNLNLGAYGLRVRPLPRVLEAAPQKGFRFGPSNR